MNLAQHRVKLLIILPLVSSIVLGFGIYELFYAPSQNFSGSIAVAWSPMQQDIVNGTLWINVTWTWQTENVSLTVKVNDDDFHGLDYVGIACDRDHNGIIESFPSLDSYASGFFPYNQGWSGLMGSNGISFFSMGLQDSEWHTCVFTNGTGYEFKILVRKTIYNIYHPSLIHLCYRDGDATPEEGRWEEYHVSIEFEV